MSKFIFVTGGVVSSLGKGLTTAALGFLLSRRGLNVKFVKFDPYINIDPEYMSPYQHGEIYVTERGELTDLDIGHYERFNASSDNVSNLSTGRIYQDVITKERDGEYDGKTVQVVPHITDQIKHYFTREATSEVDIVIVELGGTVGDIEGLPFIEAFRQFGLEHPNDVVYVHLTFVMTLKHSKEVKTKPTQHSVQKLREIGFQPNFLVCRSEKELDADIVRKIAMFCNLREAEVIVEEDVKTSIYQVPLMLHKQNMDNMICELFNFTTPEPELKDWESLIDILQNPQHQVKIAIVGRYASQLDCHKSLREALTHGGIANNAKIEIVEIEATDTEHNLSERLADVDGIVAPGGFGNSTELETIISAINFARTQRKPFLGIGYGAQCAIIEFISNVIGIDKAVSGGEWYQAHKYADKGDYLAMLRCTKALKHPTIFKNSQETIEQEKQLQQEQDNFLIPYPAEAGRPHPMRVGSFACALKRGTIARKAYNAEIIKERHRHRYEVNIKKIPVLEQNGMIVSGANPDRDWAEILEIPAHPWFVATQGHPEFKSKPNKPHPLISAFIKAALDNHLR